MVGTASIDGILERLDEEVDQALREGDARGYFAVLYRRVTASVKESLVAGVFDDAERMERLDILFADRYLDAMAARRRGDPATASWQLTFDAATRWQPLVLQHLLVGINAHINLDLGIAAAECSPGQELSGLRRDYDRINAILAAMVDRIQVDLQRISPWMGILDRVGARTQTQLVRFSIVTARAGAWRFATELAATPTARWPETIAERDRRVAAVGRRVLRPGWWMGSGLLVARLREQGDVHANLERLQGAAPPTLDEVAATLQRMDGQQAASARQSRRS